MHTRLPLAAALAAAALALAACGDDEAKTDPSTAAPDQPAQTGGTTAPTQPEVVEEGGDPKDLDAKPRVEVPKGDPPKRLVTEDIVRGKGKVARKGDSLTVHYVGVLFDGGTEFDSSWNSGQPLPFKLGAGEVIKGWDRGVAGMKVGGRRKLIIPPDLAYGPEGQPPDIPPSATLVFVVDLLKVE